MNKRFRTALLWLAVLATGSELQAARGYLSRDAARVGKELAGIYCGACHLVPSPRAVDRLSWERQVLPWMACLLGVHDGFYSPEKLRAAREAGYALAVPPLQPNQFNAIAAYYQLASPIQLHSTNATAEIFPAAGGFELLDQRATYTNNPAATLVKIREDGRGLLIGTEVPPRLLWEDRSTGRDHVLHEGSIPVSACLSEDGIYFGDVGSVTPDYRRVGKVYFVPRRGDGYGPARLVLGDLPRVSHLERADLNGDGIMDLVVCAFGWFEGKVLWLEGRRGGGFQTHEIFNRPGAVKSVVRDLNGDGRPDLALLMAQALESIFFLYNDGRGGFAGEAMVSQHPAFGYSDFELADLDGDGQPEVVTVNGDFDYEAPARPYQGLRIYVRQGERLVERFFHSLPGSYSVEVEDFDGDGDRDLVAVSFTPGLGEIRTPRSMYLENLGGLRFRFWELPFDNSGRWFIADAGDYDGDGDPDLILGALYNAPGGSVPSNADVVEAFGAIPFETLLLENLFSESRESRLAWQWRRRTLGEAWGRFTRLPAR